MTGKTIASSRTRLYSEKSFGRVTLGAHVRFYASAFVVAHAIFMAFARSKDLNRQGLDGLNVISAAQVGFVCEEDFEFGYLFETSEAQHFDF